LLAPKLSDERFVAVDDGRLNDPAFRFAFDAIEVDRGPLLADEREAKPLAPPFVRLAALKKCCEAEGALWNDAGFAVRPDGLKLSCDGEIGILPLTMLAWRNDASLIAAPPRPFTASRPKRLESIETNPERTRSLCSASFTF
jgi:hypothetical protein